MKLQGQYKRRYRIIVFLFLPVCLAIGYFLSIEIVEFFSDRLLGRRLDLKGQIIMLLSLIPLYLIGITAAKQKLRKLQSADEEIVVTEERNHI